LIQIKNVRNAWIKALFHHRWIALEWQASAAVDMDQTVANNRSMQASGAGLA